MTVYQNMNQFSQTPQKGDVSAIPSHTTLSCQITIASGDTFYPGSCVKLISGTANTILVDAAAVTEAIFGCVIRNPKKSSYVAGDAVEVALPGAIMWMESAASFNRGQLLEQVVSGQTVQAYAGVNTTIGVALDSASAANKLVRVLIRTVAEYSSSSSSSSCRSSSCSSSSSAT